MIAEILIAITILITCMVIPYMFRPKSKKKSNPEIKLMAKTFNLVPIKGHYSRHSWVIFKNARKFVDHAPKNVKSVFAYDEGNYIFYFYHLNGYDFCVELPKLVKA